MMPANHKEKNPVTTTKRKGPTFLIFFVVLIIAALFSAGLYFRRAGWRKQEERVVSRSIPNVRVMTARAESEEVPLALPGYVVGYNVTPILARTNGYLKKFLVDIGDEVKANQLLCEIETPDVDAEWIQAKSELEDLFRKKGDCKNYCGKMGCPVYSMIPNLFRSKKSTRQARNICLRLLLYVLRKLKWNALKY